MNTKIILTTLIFLTLAGLAGTASAASSVYVSPATLTKNVQSNFNVAVGVATTGDQVCTVKGTVVFNNLACQSITLADDVMAQTSPTCANPSFTIGIPTCTTTNRSLFNIAVKAGTVGTGTINFSGVNIIGYGTSLGSSSTGGSYMIITTVSAPSSSTPQTTTTPTTTQTQTTTISPEQEANSQTPETEKSVEPETTQSEMASLSNFFPWKLSTGWTIVVIVIVLIILYYIIYLIFRKKY